MTASPTLDDIRADFAILDDWEDRYRYLIELGRGLEPLPDSSRTDANKVRGCASQVWLMTRFDPGTDGPVVKFIGDSDAHIVRGLIAVLLAACSGRTAQDIIETDHHGIFAELGLREHLTPQRSNGFAAMVERMRADARSVLISS